MARRKAETLTETGHVEPPPTGNLRAEVVAEFGGELRTFRLTMAGVLELEDKCNAPIGLLFRRVQSGEYAAEDVQQSVRLGLIGGGADPSTAAKLMRSYGFPERPLAEVWMVARVVLGAAVFGFEAAPLGNAPPAVPTT